MEECAEGAVAQWLSRVLGKAQSTTTTVAHRGVSNQAVAHVTSLYLYPSLSLITFPFPLVSKSPPITYIPLLIA
jgi:hypothetical protein